MGCESFRIREGYGGPHLQDHKKCGKDGEGTTRLLPPIVFVVVVVWWWWYGGGVVDDIR
jgi:hypothetical protein